MPGGVVKTPEQEKLWRTAKAKAEKQGQKDNYAYITSIYKSMGGLNKTSMEDLFNEKVAKTGFIGKIMGKNIKPAKQEFEAALNTLKGKRDILKSERVLRRGFFDRTARAPLKYDQKQLSQILSKSPEADKVKQAKKRLDYESKESVKAALKGAAGVGVGSLLIGSKLKNKKGPYYYPEREIVASDLSKEASFKAKASRFLSGVKDLATFKNYQIAKQDLKNLKAGVNPEGLRSIDKLQNLKKNIDTLSKRNEFIKKKIDSFQGRDANTIGRVLDENVKHFSTKTGKGKDFSRINKWNKKTQNIKNLENQSRRYEDIIDTAKREYEKGHSQFVDTKDRELLKSLGLYGSALIPTTYVGKKYWNKRKKDGAS